MIPPSVLIQYDKCRLTLNLPIFFDSNTTTNIRKVFKLLDDRPYQNESTKETLDRFFPKWEQDAKDRIEQVKAELTAAMQDAEEKRRTVTALGSTLDENIKQAKQRLDYARKHAKKWPSSVEEYKEDLKAARRPKDDYQQAVKTVKHLEAEVKKAKTASDRSSKVVSIYNQKFKE